MDSLNCPHCGEAITIVLSVPGVPAVPSKKFTPPTLEEVRLECAKVGLPETEAEKFIAHHEARGWMLGKVKMKKWQAALITWRGMLDTAHKLSPTAECILRQKELERVEERMRIIRASYSEHSSWDRKDIEEHRTLRQRKAELVKLLGMAI